MDDVVVLVSGNWGDYEQPLTVWVATGPGARPGRRPISARSLSTGEPVPLTVIPLEFRNDDESRALIAAGRIPPPWPLSGWQTENWGEPPQELFGPVVPSTVAPEERLLDLALYVDRDRDAALRRFQALAAADESRARMVLLTLFIKFFDSPLPWIRDEAARLGVQLPAVGP
ncbi:MAG TPA: hypothetical protein VN408_31905 [Actinoplanes sp.]|nr:hypothetical protein [Actinoplanes sp.]